MRHGEDETTDLLFKRNYKLTLQTWLITDRRVESNFPFDFNQLIFIPTMLWCCAPELIARKRIHIYTILTDFKI